MQPGGARGRKPEEAPSGVVRPSLKSEATTAKGATKKKKKNDINALVHHLERVAAASSSSSVMATDPHAVDKGPSSDPQPSRNASIDFCSWINAATEEIKNIRRRQQQQQQQQQQEKEKEKEKEKDKEKELDHHFRPSNAAARKLSKDKDIDKDLDEVMIDDEEDDDDNEDHNDKDEYHSLLNRYKRFPSCSRGREAASSKHFSISTRDDQPLSSFSFRPLSYPIPSSAFLSLSFFLSISLLSWI